MKIRNLWVCLAACAVMPGFAVADITPIGEFTGDVSEDFTAHANSPIHVPTLNIFENHSTINILTSNGSITVTPWSSLGGDVVSARSSPIMVGQLGVLEWNFHQPISQFGAFFENNSRFDDATVEFYDGNNNLIGSMNATTPSNAQQWIWNGWNSDTPIHRIVTIGNDVEFLSGFIWYDDAQITFASNTIPEPTSGLLVAVMCLVGMNRRRRRR